MRKVKSVTTQFCKAANEMNKENNADGQNLEKRQQHANSHKTTEMVTVEWSKTRANVQMQNLRLG